MLFSLITVLVLLVVAFYALWVGVTGRINGNEGPELTIPGRAMVLGIALVALGATYLVYKHSRKHAPVVTAAAQAMPSNPPDSRGSPEVAAPPAGTVVGDEEPDADLAATEPKATVATAEPAPEPAEPQAIAATPSAPQKPTVAIQTDVPRATLSQAAAELEAEQTALRRQITETARPEVPPATLRPARQPELAAAAPASPPRSRVRARSPRGGLVLHVHNALGSDQASELLTLSIEGKPVAEIAVDDKQPRVAVAVPLPRPGLLHYRLEGVSESDGRTRLVGEGCIRVRDGARFAVRRKAGSQKVFLEATRGL